MAEQWSTPVNKITRENMKVLIENNRMNESFELTSDFNAMELDSPIRKPCFQPIVKKLFHSPVGEKKSNEPNQYRRKAQKRKRLEDSCEFQKVFVKECDRDSYSPDACDGMRKRMLISLISNKEYSVDMS